MACVDDAAKILAAQGESKVVLREKGHEAGGIVQGGESIYEVRLE